MVGIVILKNFEVGSYEHMRITVFNGNSYSDIENGEPIFSYIANPDTQYLKNDFSSQETCESLPLEDIFFIARSAREYFYENTSATQLNFKLSGKDIHFKIRSRAHGVCAPANYRSLFLNDSLYMHISSEENHTYTYLSAMCDALNFAVQKIFDISEEVYFCTCTGLYVNIALFNPLLVKFAKRDVPLGIIIGIFGLNRRKTIRLKTDFTYNPSFPDKSSATFRREAIHLYRKLKYNMYKQVSDILSLTDGKTDILRCLFSLPSKESIREIVYCFEEEINEYSLKYFEYGYIDVKSHCEMMSVREILSLLLDISDIKNFNKELSARSSHRKFCFALPNPEYIFSDATAIWQKGR